MAPTHGTQAQPRRKWLRPALWVVGWALVAFPLARAQLADMAVLNRMPQQALLLDAGNARALAALGAALQVSGDQQNGMTLARGALKREPLNVVALRTLGLALEQSGDVAGANRVMFLAGTLGWRDVALQLWLLKAYALKDDVASALRRADALARIGKQSNITLPIFLASLPDDRTRAALVAEMKDRPTWRGPFFYKILQLPADQMPYVGRLIAELAAAGSPITPAERAIYLTRLVQVGQARAAYDDWLRSRPAAQRGGAAQGGAALSWDGGFERVPATGTLGAPFEWQLTPESTGIAGIEPADAGGQRLWVSPGRDYRGRVISQTMVLAPGRYRLDARVKGDPASAGLRWSIRCVPGDSELPQNVGVPDGNGRPFATVAFTVPAGCTAQSLAVELEASDGEGGENVTIDDVTIREVG
ncbi:hypothetical protein [Sphingomonas sp.]|uniref:hypothetical protein n=1 Tax=Sphingomonas sp. TaxID=28214 RepID=UPI0035C83024